VLLLVAAAAAVVLGVVAPAMAVGRLRVKADRASMAGWRVQPSANRSTRGNQLLGVSATSSTNAWAVGSYYNGSAYQTLIEHWNGKAWKAKPSPNPNRLTFPTHELAGVTVTSRTNAWAVGSSQNNNNTKTLIEHWNGKKWTVTPSPSPGAFPSLSSVVATSSTNAWAVGSYNFGTTLIEHWNGKTWTVQKSPNGPGGTASYLSGVAATSSTDAWAVGNSNDDDSPNSSTHVLVEHWNGTAWKRNRAPTPAPDGEPSLYAVAATSRTNAWAVGFFNARYGTFIEHWNGKVWKVQKGPNAGQNFPTLYGVAATSPTNAWAVGSYESKKGKSKTMIEHWNGRTWKGSPSPNPGSGPSLSSVFATSSTNAWAVGTKGQQTLIEHWSGNTAADR
jgi:hypothetical protein